MIRQSLFMAVLLICSISVFAQKDSIYVWNKWCSRRDTLLLFTASYNVIEVYCPSLQAKDISLKSLDKTLKISNIEIEGDTLTEMAMPYTIEKPMRLALVNNNTGKVIKTILFTGDEVPNPRARLGHIHADEAPKMNILAQVGLKIEFPNSLYSYPYHIKQFGFKTHYNKTDINLTANGYLITKDMENAISNAPVGTIIEFTDIKATCPECVIRTLDNLRLKVQ